MGQRPRLGAAPDLAVRERRPVGAAGARFAQRPSAPRLRLQAAPPRRSCLDGRFGVGVNCSSYDARDTKTKESKTRRHMVAPIRDQFGDDLANSLVEHYGSADAVAARMFEIRRTGVWGEGRDRSPALAVRSHRLLEIRGSDVS
jgi:hypothetical protein